MKRVNNLCLTVTMAAALAGCGGGADSPELVELSTAVTTPTAVNTTLRFTDLAVGLHHACGLTALGEAYCWGSNEYGQLGTTLGLTPCDGGNASCAQAPVPVTTTLRFSHIAASLRDTCGLTATGEIWCWGYGQGGQLGNGLGTDSSTPVQVSAPVVFTSVSLGGSGLVDCALGQAGDAYCWGPGGAAGGLGDGSADGSDVPIAVSGGLVFSQLTVGDGNACGLTTNASAYCWGEDDYGKLGLGVTMDSTVPAPVVGGLTFTVLSAGIEQTCGLTADGSAYCWGFPPAVGSPVSSGAATDAPIAVSGDLHFTTLSSGQNFSCGLDGNGAVWCWGQGVGGVLGQGSQTDSAVPVQATTAERFATLRAGGSVCALTASGQAFCWGDNTFGQIGG